MQQFLWPTSAEISAIEQQFIQGMTADAASDPIFKHFPIVSKDVTTLIWEQLDNFAGMTNVRGLGGSPSRVLRVGVNQYMVKPGYYGEYITLEESELTERRQMGSFGTPIDISDLVVLAQRQLITRRVTRWRKQLWDLAVLGQFTSYDPKTNQLSHADGYTQRTYAASVSWSTFATATPLLDFRSVQLFGRGFAANFGASAEAYMNRTTVNNMMQNGNASDLYGRRTGGFGTLNSLPDINKFFQGDDLPQIVVNDKVWLDDGNGNAKTLYIPNNTVVVVAPRDTGARTGYMALTRNANNAGLQPGAYSKVIDLGEVRVPREIQVHDGFNGAPVIEFPSSIVVMSV
jgi:hypothetical protein